MLRSLSLTFALILGLALGAFAQVSVNSGYATTYPAGVPASIANTVTTENIPAVPAINTPAVHVGPTTEQAPPGEQPGISPAIPLPVMSSVENTAQGNPLAPTYAVEEQQGHFWIGAATFSVNPFLGSGTGTNGESLGEIARTYKQKDQNINARVYTNDDIGKLQGNIYSGAAATANAGNDNWPANNGVIMPEPATNGAIAAPAENQSTTGITAAPSTSSPFAPKPQSDNMNPSTDRPVEMASNNPPNAGVPQSGSDQAPASANANNDQRGALPKTATRLPLLGMLGFLSVSMGLFVRYQRRKATR